jgi:hypothetical protein
VHPLDRGSVGGRVGRGELRHLDHLAEAALAHRGKDELGAGGDLDVRLEAAVDDLRGGAVPGVGDRPDGPHPNEV